MMRPFLSLFEGDPEGIGLQGFLVEIYGFGCPRPKQFALGLMRRFEGLCEFEFDDFGH